MQENPFHSEKALIPHPSEKVEFVRYTEAYRRAAEIKEARMKGREPKDFIGGAVYTRDAIGKIEDRVEELDKLFAAEKEKKTQEQRDRLEQAEMMADCLESIFLHIHSWLGPASKAYPTTKWDDYVNGVDLIIERGAQAETTDYNGLAVDITYGGPKTISKKVKRIRDRILHGELAHVDFFKSEDGRYKGQLKDIPLVVVGADANTMKGLVNLFAEKSDEALVFHPFQFQIIEQIMIQCDFFIKTAQKVSDQAKSRQIIMVYTKLKQTFENVLKLKSKTIPSEVDRHFRDSFHENLQSTIQQLDEEVL